MSEPATVDARLETLTPEQLQVLFLLSLFDHPPNLAALRALLQPPPIPGLTNRLFVQRKSWFGLAKTKVPDSEESLQGILDPLRDQGLLLTADLGQGLDIQPEVRESVAARFQAEHAEAWREGNRRLYEYYKTSTDEFPETLEQVLPLYAAVVHGCRAGRQQEALDDVLYKRIRRGARESGWNKLHAYDSELTALEALFERPWDRPAAALKPADQAWLLKETAYVLRSLGQPSESVAPLEAQLERSIEQKAWKDAAAQAGNLSGLTLKLGRVAAAVEFAARAVDLADRSEEARWKIVSRAVLANALHQAGELDASAARFEEAEALQAQHQPQVPRLDSGPGYQYCDLLLSQGAAPEVVQRRAEEMLARDLQFPNSAVLDIAFDHLMLGRLHLASGQLPAAAAALEQALDGLWDAGDDDDPPRGLLVRAALYRRGGDVPAARRDLEEVLEIAERGSMRLHEADAHLEWARLLLSEGCVSEEGREEAREHVATARRIVDETGYGRRIGEVEALEAEVGAGSS